jgi:hypothetical protein
MTTMISITLPSLSEALIERALHNLDETSFSPCEIIVVSPTPPQRGDHRSRVIWVEDRNLAGANAAHELGFLYATGTYVLAWVDDHALRHGWDVHARLAIETAETSNRLIAVGLRHADEQVGTCFGLYYPYFPMMRRSRVLEIGGWLSSEYRIGFADVDLAMRVWARGGRCEPVSPGVVDRLSEDERKLGGLYQEAHTTRDDLALFLDRWAGTLGAGWPTAHVRDFNVDVRGSA